MPEFTVTRLVEAFLDAPSADQVRLAPGEVLMGEGDNTDTVYLLLDGSLRVSRRVDDDTVVIATIETPGSLVGEMVALGGGNRTATVIAQEATRLVSLQVDDFRQLLSSDRRLAGILAEVAIERAEEGELAEILATHFGIVDQRTLTATCSAVRWHRIPQGEALFRQGDESESVYFVVRGRLVATRHDPTGEEVKVGEMGRGDVVGEVGLLGHAPRSATVTAIRDTVVAEMTERTFLELIDGQPRMMVSLYLDAVARAQSPRWHSAPTTVVGLVGPGRIDIESVAGGLAGELGRQGRVGRLSPSIIDTALETPGIADSERGGIEDLRVSRLVHEAELEADFLLIELGSDLGPWSRRAMGMIDHLLVVVTPDMESHEQEALGTILGWCPTGVGRTVVVAHGARRQPSGSGALRASLGAEAVVHVVTSSPSDLARLARIAVGRANTLVLSGGGGRGFAHIGVFRALTELGFPIDRVGGTSIGAILGAVIAQGLTPEEVVAWAEAKFADVLDYTLPLVSLTKGAAIARHAYERFGHADIEDLWYGFFAMSTDLTSSRPYVHDSESVALAIRATSAIPGVMPPVPHGGALLIDGGVLNNLPLDVARSRAPRGLIIASDVAPPRGPGAHGDYGLSVSGWQALWARFLRDRSPYPGISAVLMRSMITASMRERDAQVTGGLADCYLDLDIRGVSMLDFASPAEVAARGYDAAMPTLESWLASVEQRDPPSPGDSTTDSGRPHRLVAPRPAVGH